MHDLHHHNIKHTRKACLASEITPQASRLRLFATNNECQLLQSARLQLDPFEELSTGTAYRADEILIKLINLNDISAQHTAPTISWSLTA